MLNGEQVPNAEKIYSIFEPHTDLIKRGKVRTPIEFGHKVFLAESAQGLTPMGVPPALPGRQQKFDVSGGRHRRSVGEAPNREPPSTRRGVRSMDDDERLGHTKWSANSRNCRLQRLSCW